MPTTKEPEITINGIRLDLGQAATVRVAIESFASELAENGLGQDEHGKRMTIAYLDRISEIRRMIFTEDES